MIRGINSVQAAIQLIEACLSSSHKSRPAYIKNFTRKDKISSASYSIENNHLRPVIILLITITVNLAKSFPFRIRLVRTWYQSRKSITIQGRLRRPRSY
jgi:hypothetical protein